MDKHLILTFSSVEAAQTTLAAINALSAQWWQSQGYTVIDGQLIGKNAATGEDEPGSARTLTWDEVKTAPDGTIYFSSLRNDARFVDGLEMLPAEIQALYTEIEFPDAWKAVGE